MMYSQHKFNHFQFWILHSLEFRLNDMSSKLTELAKAKGGNSSDKRGE